MNEQPADIWIAALADPSKVVLPPVEFCREPDRARQRDPALSGIGAHLRPRQSTQSHQLARSQDRREPTGVSSFTASTSTCREMTACLISTLLSSSQSCLRRACIAGVARDVELESACPWADGNTILETERAHLAD